MKRIVYILVIFLLYNNIYAKSIDLSGTLPYYIEEGNNVYAISIGNYIMDVYGSKDDFVIYDYSDYQNLTETDKLNIMQKIIEKIPNCIYFPAYNNKQTDILGTYIDKTQIDYINISDSKNYYWNATIYTKQNNIIYAIFDDKRRIKLSKTLKINILK